MPGVANANAAGGLSTERGAPTSATSNIINILAFYCFS
jgi:hypothetical protein